LDLRGSPQARRRQVPRPPRKISSLPPPLPFYNPISSSFRAFFSSSSALVPTLPLLHPRPPRSRDRPSLPPRLERELPRAQFSRAGADRCARALINPLVIPPSWLRQRPSVCQPRWLARPVWLQSSPMILLSRRPASGIKRPTVHVSSEAEEAESSNLARRNASGILESSEADRSDKSKIRRQVRHTCSRRTRCIFNGGVNSSGMIKTPRTR